MRAMIIADNLICGMMFVQFLYEKCTNLHVLTTYSKTIYLKL